VLSINPSYGHRRIALALNIGKKRVRRVMKLNGIKPYKRQARWTKRRDLRRPEAKYQNQIKGSSPIRPNIIWVSDFTYLKYQEKVIYLATFMDLFTREIVGWHISGKHTKELIIEAFIDGFKTTGTIPKIVHSDQGSEFNSENYTSFIQSLGVRVSMSKKASPWENAYQESFYNNFKTDLGLEFDRFESVAHFIEAIHQTINYYNQERIHLALKMPPEKFKFTHLPT
jgi:putative transposase